MRMMVLMLATALVMASPARAAEEKAADAPAQTEKAVPSEAGKMGDNPYMKPMQEKAVALAKNVDEAEAQRLGHVRDNFGMIRSIDVARKTVGEAVDLCGAKNPDMRKDIVDRYVKWEAALGGALKKQEKAMAKAVSEKNFTDPKAVQDYLDTIDKAAVYADNKIEKTIVTTPEACKNLMNSMDSTEKTILGLIEPMEWPDASKDASKDSEKAGDKEAGDKAP